MTHRWRMPAAMLLALLLMAGAVHAQGRGAPQGPPATGRDAAPIDLTGYWVAEITEDWRWRMVTPAKGDYQSVPITPAAQMAADAWDPAKDTAAGEQCRAYGAPILMRTPTRLNITWQDNNTISVQTDNGQQTRLLHFGDWTPPGGAPTWQGDSVARWVTAAGVTLRPVAATRDNAARAPNAFGSLEVVTTNLRPGYLRKNGIPYSADTVYTEIWDVIKESNGDTRILILLQVNDPVNLQTPWIVPVHFKKEPDGSKWDPTPCSSTW